MDRQLIFNIFFGLLVFKVEHSTHTWDWLRVRSCLHDNEPCMAGNTDSSSDVLWFILQRCHYFKWNCKMAGKWFGRKRLCPIKASQDLPLMLERNYEKPVKKPNISSKVRTETLPTPKKKWLSDTAKANCSKHLVFTVAGTDLHKLVVLWTCFGDRHQDFYNDWDHNATTPRADELNIWPKKKKPVFMYY